jgi:hypothetical protein
MEDKIKIISLIADLNALAVGWRPSAGQLEQAPILNEWIWALDPDTHELVLQGCVSGHPILPDGLVTTSAVMAAGLTDRWARTFNRFYRLGEARRND